MADAVDSLVIISERTHYALRIQNISDGTGESLVAKIDKSTLTDVHGQQPVALDLLEMSWSIQGFSSVKLFWDHTTDDEIAVLSGNGYRDYRATGGLRDPRSAGTTGNILLSTAGAISGATYDIELTFALRASA